MVKHRYVAATSIKTGGKVCGFTGCVAGVWTANME